MSQGKKNSDGTKRRTSNRSKSRDGRAPASAPRPVAPGYVRKDEGHMTGASDSIAEFIIDTFSRLGDFALQEVDEQKTGKVGRRPFNSHGDASVDFGATYLFEVKGYGKEDPEFNQLLEDIKATGGVYITTTLDGLPFTVGERIGILASRAEEEITKQLDAELLYAFTTGAFVLVTDFDLLIEFRLEQRPPRALPEFKPNRPDLS
jgi:hypothetical protein